MIPKPELPPLPRSVAEATAECRTLYERYWPELRPRLLAALPPPDGSPVTVAADPQVILLTAAGVSNEGPSSWVLVLVPALSWPWVSAWGSLEPPRRDGENAQKPGKNGGKMGEIQPKTCEGRS